MLAEAKRRGREYSLDVYGEGPLHDDLLRRNPGPRPRRHDVHGFRPEARRFLPGYRAYVHACYSESFCIAIAEGMAAGLPVVVGPIGPIPELCDDGVEGRYRPLDDVCTGNADILIETLEQQTRAGPDGAGGARAVPAGVRRGRDRPAAHGVPHGAIPPGRDRGWGAATLPRPPLEPTAGTSPEFNGPWWLNRGQNALYPLGQVPPAWIRLDDGVDEGRHIGTQGNREA